MITSPIIPVWIMGIICVILLILFRSKNGFTFMRQIIIISLLFIINLRIMVMSKNAKTANIELDMDVVFVIDTTVSMVAEDYNGNNPRMDGVKENCEYIIDSLNGAKFSIITFGNSSLVRIPMTKDVDTVKSCIDVIETEYQRYATGTSLDLSIDDLNEVLENAYKRDKSRTRVVFYISDGELLEGSEKMKSFKKCNEYIDEGAVLGYGTKDGGKMKFENYDGKKEYVTYVDSNYRTIDGVSKIDEKNLEKIAKELNVDYVHVTKKKDIKEKIDEIVDKANEKISDDKKSLYSDTYYIFMVPLVALLGYEYINYRRKL